MATGINKVIILGRCGKDPDVKQTAGGLTITNLSIATSESWNDKTTGEKTQRTEWHYITFFGKLAELIGNTVKKGSLLYVEGKLNTQKWDDKQTGEKKSKIVIHGDSVQFLDSKSVVNAQEPTAQTNNGQYPRNNNQYAKPNTQQNAPSSNDFYDDPIPF